MRFGVLPSDIVLPVSTFSASSLRVERVVGVGSQSVALRQQQASRLQTKLGSLTGIEVENTASYNRCRQASESRRHANPTCGPG